MRVTAADWVPDESVPKGSSETAPRLAGVFCFEAFGTVNTFGNGLRAAAEALAARNPPNLAGGQIASYPTWLAKLIRETSQ